jgi:exodeoxyribonuclease X
MKVLIIDTETTGLVAPEPIEIAYFGLGTITNLRNSIFLGEDTIIRWLMNDLDSYYLERFNPSKAIDAGASRVNGIYKKDLLTCRKSSEFTLPTETEYFIGHNIAFDHRTLGKPNVKLICTKELSLLTFNRQTGLGNNKLTTLIEFLYPGRNLTINAHGALHDCKLVYLLLIKILEKLPKIGTWDELSNLCSQGKATKSYEELNKTLTKLEVMPFGKYKDLFFSEVPKDYLKWLIKQEGLSPNLEVTIKFHLGN